MDSNNIIILIIVLAFLKWFFYIILLPFLYFYGKYKKTNRLIFKLLSAPFIFINCYMTKGGLLLLYMRDVCSLPSCSLRKTLILFSGANIAKNVCIHIDCNIRAPYNLIIGEGSQIGDHAVLDARSGIVIGENVNISSNVSVWTLQHDYRNKSFDCFSTKDRNMKVVIEKHVWLGCNVVVLPGCIIGEGAVCCAGSVITKDVAPFSVVAGIPAKKIADRPHTLIYKFKQKSHLY